MRIHPDSVECFVYASCLRIPFEEGSILKESQRHSKKTGFRTAVSLRGPGISVGRKAGRRKNKILVNKIVKELGVRRSKGFNFPIYFTKV